MPLTPGGNFGPFRVIDQLGSGGMASVFRAYDPGLDRYVALKVLPPEFLHDETFAARFTREAKVIARLEHKDIVPIYGYGIDEGIPWMAMRLISGGSLSAALQTQRMSTARAIAIVRDVAEALDYAHAEGVVHRDVKPQNILLDDEGDVYLADFGIARMTEGAPAMTTTGMVNGTPKYMAPEQALGQPLDHHADIYALGIVAYEIFTGTVPFDADTPLAVMMKHVRDPIPLGPLQDVPEPLRRAVLKAVAKDPADRWPSAAAFAQALERGAPASDASETMPALVALEDTESGESVPRTIRRPSGPAPAAPRRRLPVLLLGCTGVAVLFGLVALIAGGALWHRFAGSGGVRVEARMNAKEQLEYVLIPAGSFELGCVPTDVQCQPDEKPARHVTLAKGFWLERTEVTVAAFAKFVADTGYQTDAEKAGGASTFDGTNWTKWPATSWRTPGFNQDDRSPVVDVSWKDAAAYCEWAGGRLPTDAEWEYAGRGGRGGTKYVWGDAMIPIIGGRKQVNLADESTKRAYPMWQVLYGYDDGYATTSPVASFPPNSFGLYDMAGNVWEWISDPGVLRGGSWNNDLSGQRISFRLRLDPSVQYFSFGMRCARDARPR